MSNKVVLITGSCHGLGLEIAKTFAKEGFNVALNYSSESSKARAQEAIKELEVLAKSFSKEIIIKAYQANCQETESVNKTVEQVISDFSCIDVLVNNAGITKDGLSFRMSDEDWQRVLDVNLSGTFRFTRAVSSHMLRRRQGNIVNISSIVGLHGNPGQANYAASKAGIIAYTKTLAKELASRFIIVNAVTPGAIETDMFNSLKPEIKDSIIQSIPLKRAAKAEEVANLVYFLANQNYITGQAISIDGGMGI